MKHTEDIYLYDGTFEGLMTVIYYLLENKIIPLNILKDNFNLTLFSNYYNLKTNMTRAKKMINFILKKISSLSLYMVYNVFLSSEEGKELVIFYYLMNGFKHGSTINSLKLNCVIKTYKISKYVRGEAHLLKGFIRFKEASNKVLYAEIGPKNNVLQIVSNHFKERLAGETWMIHDLNHHLVSLYKDKKLIIVDDKDFDFSYFKNNTDKKIELLWQSFFKTVAIKERTNKKCQMNHMPKRYWKYMIEMKGELNEQNC